MPRELGTDPANQPTPPRLRPVRTLVLHHGVSHGNVLGHLAVPFRHAARSPDCRCRLELLHAADEERRLRHIAGTRPDVVIDLRSWRDPCETIAAFIERVREASPRSAYVLLDAADQTTSEHLALIPHVDLFAKGQILTDRSAYATDYEGGYVFTDYIARTLGIDLDGWHFGARVPPEWARRMHLSWNVATLRGGGHLAAAIARIPGRSRRPIGLHLRAGSGGDGWYRRVRAWSARMAAAAAAAAGVTATPSTRIPRPRYLAELAASRIAFSPFGWGEVCFRDFEAAAFGAVLLKPDVSHLRTRPNIFEPMRTYVPVRWDLADLADRISWIESHPDEADAIARNAACVLRDWFRERGAISAVEELVQAAMVTREHRGAADSMTAEPVAQRQ